MRHYFLMIETINLVDGYKFTDKDRLDFIFILVHDRGDRRGGSESERTGT